MFEQFGDYTNFMAGYSIVGSLMLISSILIVSVWYRSMKQEGSYAKNSDI